MLKLTNTGYAVDKCRLQKKAICNVDSLDKSKLVMLTRSQVAYFKRQYGSYIENFYEIKDTETTWWVRAEDLDRGEYGSLFYITNSDPWGWCKVYEITIEHIKFTVGDVLRELLGIW